MKMNAFNLLAGIAVILAITQVCSASNKFKLQPVCSKDDAVTKARAVISSSGSITAEDGSTINYSVSGTVTFEQLDKFRTRIKAVFTGVAPFRADSDNFYLHVHQLGTVEDSCADAADHYNPCNQDHSDNPLTKRRHVGDVAVVKIRGNKAVINKIDYQVKLSGPLSVLGRSVVIHAGAAAPRVGCATIAVAN